MNDAAPHSQPGAATLRLLRRTRNLTLKEASERAGVSISYLSELERNSGKNASMEIVDRISRAFQLSERERNELLNSFGLGSGRLRAALLIDGRWLDTWATRLLTQALPNRNGVPFRVDFNALANLLIDKLGGGFDFTRRLFFTSEPVNLHPADTVPAAPKIQRIQARVSELRERFRYEVIVSPADYQRGEIRLRKEDRPNGHSSLPVPNPVPMALATEVLFQAALPNNLDIAILFAGDEVYQPTLRALRRIGKRVALVTIGVACDRRLLNAGPEVLDWNPILIDDPNLAILRSVEQKREERRVECSSRHHLGERAALMDEIDSGDGHYWCLDCRQRQTAEFLARSKSSGERPLGIVSVIHPRGYGFIRVSQTEAYFFHASSLPSNTELYSLQPGTLVEFEPTNLPGRNPGHRHGTATHVRRVAPQF